MKALKDCEWTVSITIFHGAKLHYWWTAYPKERNAFITQDKTVKSRRGAQNHWKRFAKLNGITNYKYE